MPGTRAEDIFEELKKVFELRKHLTKSFGTPTWPFKKFWYPYRKAQNSSKSVSQWWNLAQLYLT